MEYVEENKPKPNPHFYIAEDYNVEVYNIDGEWIERAYDCNG